MTAKLRHIAMIVDDLQETAAFYEKSFGMKRVRELPTAVGLTDGYMNIVIIHHSNENVAGEQLRGLHHLGFMVDDLDAAAAQVQENGAVYHGIVIGADKAPITERKYRDPNGLMFDIATPEHARRVWRVLE